MTLIAAQADDPVGFAERVFRGITAPACGWMMRFFRDPPAAVLAVVKLGLCDKSSRVREWACEGVENAKARELVPVLEEMARSDPHPIVRWAADHAAQMTANGFVAKRADNGDWEIEREEPSRYDNGIMIFHTNVPAAIVEQYGLHSVVEMLKADDPRVLPPEDA